jgi:hypothetical protein
MLFTCMTVAVATRALADTARHFREQDEGSEEIGSVCTADRSRRSDETRRRAMRLSSLVQRPNGPLAADSDRQLCIMLTHPVSLLLDTTRACTVAK